jgi:hypothetical protein
MKSYLQAVSYLLFALLIGSLIYTYWRRKNHVGVRFRKVPAGAIPLSVSKKIQETYPHLTGAQVRRVIDGLRAFFEISQQAKGRIVSMPSVAVDTAWHEFICNTRAYGQFCKRTFGRYLHHTPNEAMPKASSAREGIQRAWVLSCRREGLHVRSPARLPILFAIDSELNIAGGYRYSVDCSRPGYTDTYCGAELGRDADHALWEQDSSFDSHSSHGHHESHDALSDVNSGSYDSGSNCGGSSCSSSCSSD